MIVGVPKEILQGEVRVALVPASVPDLAKRGIEVWIERGAGEAAGYPDQAYEQAGAKLAADRDEIFAKSDLVAAVRLAGAQEGEAAADTPRLRKGQVLVAAMEPLWAAEDLKPLAEAGSVSFALELIPRITRAQSMDILSSMATIAGYKGVLLAASTLPRMFPMMMTAAGTVKPAKVLVIGAGVAGLQAISSARRLGALVSAYDVRPVVKEQVESLGARFVELEMETSGEGQGGYAREQTEDEIRRQQELMADVIADSDVVISTAAIPGRRSPVIVTRAMVERMAPGSVIVDLASERGGNCELTRAGETVVHGGVTILGPVNLPATVPFHASQMFAKNVTTLLQHLVADGELKLDLDDEITRGTLATHEGRIVHPQVCEALGIEAPAAPETAAGKGDD